MRNKSEMEKRDRFSRLYAALKAAEALVSFRARGAVTTVTVEDEDDKLWDDIVEREAGQKGCRRHQVKRQLTPLDEISFSEYVAAAAKGNPVDHFHFAYPAPIEVDGVGELRILVGLCDRVQQEGADHGKIAAELRPAEQKWVGKLREWTGKSVADVLDLLRRVEIDFIGDERELTKRARRVLEPMFGAGWERAWKEIVAFVSDKDGVVEIHPDTLLKKLSPPAVDSDVALDWSVVRDSEKQAEAAAQGRTVNYVEQFTDALRKHYTPLITPPGVKLSDVQSARRAGDAERASELIEAARRPGSWEILIHPKRIGGRVRFDTLAECWRAAERACVPHSRVSEFPSVRHGNRSSGTDWIDFTYNLDRDIETWRLSQFAAFAWMSPISDDLKPPTGWVQVENKSFPERTLDLDEAVRNVTLAFRFAARLAGQLDAPGGDEFVVSVRLTRTALRALRPSRGMLRGEYRANVAELQNAWTCTRSDLEADADGLAARACFWFFERFNWQHMTPEEVAQLQESALSR